MLDWFMMHAPSPYAALFDDASLRAVADRQVDERRTPDRPPSQPTSMLAPHLAAALGDAGDLVSTQIALAHGASEANPLVPTNRVGNAATLAAYALGTQYLMHRLAKEHPKIAKAIGYGTGALGAFNTVRNLHNAQLWDQVHAQQGSR